MKKTKMFLLLIAMLFAVAFTACGGGGGGGGGGRNYTIYHWRLGFINMGQCNMGTVSRKSQRVKDSELKSFDYDSLTPMKLIQTN